MHESQPVVRGSHRGPSPDGHGDRNEQDGEMLKVTVVIHNVWQRTRHIKMTIVMVF